MKTMNAGFWRLSEPVQRCALYALAACIACAVIGTLQKTGADWSLLQRASVGTLLLTIIAAAAYRISAAIGWWFALRAVGASLHPGRTTCLWLASEACRWLPGSLWNFGSRAVLAGRAGVSASRIGASLCIELAATITAWGVVAGILFTNREALLRVSETWPKSINAAWLVAGIAVAALGGWLLRRRLGAVIQAKISGLQTQVREAMRLHFSWAWCGALLGWMAVGGVGNGLTLWLLIDAVGMSPPPAAVVIGSNAAAWLIGFFAVFAPSGIVVREGALAWMLSPWLGPLPAAAIAVLWRVVVIAAEIACLMLSAPFLARDRKAGKSSAHEPRAAVQPAQPNSA